MTTHAMEATIVDTSPSLASYRALIGATLAELCDLEPLVDELISGHQSGRGFLSVEGAQIQNQQVRLERFQRALARQKGLAIARGDMPAPGSIAAYSLAAEIHAELGQIVRDTMRQLEAAGICLVPGVSVPTRIVPLVAEVQRVLAVDARTGRLRAIHTTLEELTARTRRLIDGNDRERLPDPCPYCGLPTLVVYHQEGVIRCEADPHTGQKVACTCTDSMCPCHGRPVQHRHEWHRERGHKRWGWYDLAAAQRRATWTGDA